MKSRNSVFVKAGVAAFFFTVSWVTVLCGAVNLAADQEASGQHPSFEVASVKTVPIELGDMYEKMQDYRPIGFFPHSSPSRVRIQCLSLAGIIAIAYELRVRDIQGPDWIGSQRFDIDATVPPDTSLAIQREMLRNLLSERFSLRVHKGVRSQNGYALVAEARGTHLKPAESSDGGTVGRGAPSSPSADDARLAQKKTELVQDHDSFASFSLKSATLSQLADALARYTDGPVVDMTKIEGKYDFAMDVAPSAADQEFNAPGASLIRALKGFGLKLERRNVTKTILIVDHASPAPTGN